MQQFTWSSARSILSTIGWLMVALFATAVSAGGPSKPNFLFILADDCNYNLLGCYGGKDVKTPNIDNLAAEGLRFERAYCASAMCAPFRAELYTGLYPARSGVDRNHASAKQGTKSVAHYLSALGYRVGITGKRHIKPAAVYPFKSVKDFPAGEGVRQFMTGDPEQPFCLFLCSNNPHAPWTTGDATKFKASTVTLAPLQHDNAPTREAMTRYLAEVADFDREVGEILSLLSEVRLADNTLVMLSSEQGWPLGFAKWTNWDLGVHTALIARWPNKIALGVTTDALVQMADVLPTLIDAAGGDAPSYGLDGTSFLKVLQGESDTHRNFVYGLHNNVPEGQPYAIRSIRDNELHYILNLDHESSYHEKHVMVQDSRLVWWPALRAAGDKGDKRAKYLLKKFHQRPREELYLVDQDPYELRNLADDPKFAERKQRLSDELHRWMKEQNDPGVDKPKKTAQRR